MSTSDQDKPKQQSFYGAGSFGGDNNGTINNVLLDLKTKVVLTELSKKVPELDALLRKALRDGVLSPDAVIALNRAVNHINEETAQAFLFAARHINEDVAVSFEAVAEKIKTADQQLSARVSELNAVSASLHQSLGQINGALAYRVQPANSAGVATRPSRRTSAERWFILKLISVSVGAALVTAVILRNHHLGGPTVAAGAVALTIPVLIWINKVWR